MCSLPYPGVQVGANVHVSDLAYADDIVILSSSYNEMQGLLEARSQNLSRRVSVGSIRPVGHLRGVMKLGRREGDDDDWITKKLGQEQATWRLSSARSPMFVKVMLLP